MSHYELIAAGWTTIRDGAAAAGRGPHALELIVRAAPTFSDAALGPTRAPFTGSWRQIPTTSRTPETSVPTN